MARTGVLFEEELRFSPRLLWILAGLMIGTVLLVAGIFGYGLYQQLALGRPWGKQPMSDANLVWFSVGIVTFMVVMEVPALWLLFTAHQQVRLTSTRLTLTAPLAGRTIATRDIASWDIRRSRSYGLQYTPGRGWVVNLGGHHCVHIRTRHQRRFAVGTSKPEAFEAALRTARGLESED